MTPDPEQRLPRELLKELIEEGSVETTPTGTRPRRCQLEWDSFKSGFHKYVTWTSIPDPWSEGAARRKP